MTSFDPAYLLLFRTFVLTTKGVRFSQILILLDSQMDLFESENSGFSIDTRHVSYMSDRFHYNTIKHPGITISYGGSSVDVQFVKAFLPVPVTENTLWDELTRTFPTFQHRVTHGWCYGDPGATMDTADRVMLHIPIRGGNVLDKLNIRTMFELVHRLYDFPQKVRDHIRTTCFAYTSPK